MEDMIPGTRFFFDGSTKMPDEVRHALALTLLPLDCLLPGWVYKCRLEYAAAADENPRHTVAECNSAWEYRNANISVYSTWLDDDLITRRRNIIHELIHIVHHGMYETACDIAVKLIEERPVRELVNAQLVQFNEGATQDLALIIYDLLERCDAWGDREDAGG